MIKQHFTIHIYDFGEEFPVKDARFITTLDNGEAPSEGIAAANLTDTFHYLLKAVRELKTLE